MAHVLHEPIDSCLVYVVHGPECGWRPVPNFGCCDQATHAHYLVVPRGAIGWILRVSEHETVVTPDPSSRPALPINQNCHGPTGMSTDTKPVPLPMRNVISYRRSLPCGVHSRRSLYSVTSIRAGSLPRHALGSVRRVRTTFLRRM